MKVYMKRVEVVAAILIHNNLVFACQRGYGEFKDGWEFPGGKVEAGESPEEALRREIREELEVDVNVGDLIDTIEYDYPAFHLSMKCYACTIAGGSPHLLEHEAARWLSADQLDSVAWLPADITLIPKIAGLL
jgi:8-oxo-dGTP diphosphatase